MLVHDGIWSRISVKNRKLVEGTSNNLDWRVWRILRSVERECSFNWLFPFSVTERKQVWSQQELLFHPCRIVCFLFGTDQGRGRYKMPWSLRLNLTCFTPEWKNPWLQGGSFDIFLRSPRAEEPPSQQEPPVLSPGFAPVREIKSKTSSTLAENRAPTSRGQPGQEAWRDKATLVRRRIRALISARVTPQVADHHECI